MTPEPFHIAVADSDLADLNQRLAHARLPDDYANDDWSYGVERGWLAGMLDYWRGTFDWRAQEAAMNAFPQYRVEIDGAPIHFLHVRGRGPAPRPLILTHGWPWTFWDWGALIGPLTDPAAHGGRAEDAFDVVVPSLPGFGFSSPLRRAGVNRRTTAQRWRALMRDVLGYDRYFASGGDWGSFVTQDLAEFYPDGLQAIYVSLPVPPGVDVRSLSESEYAPDEAWMVARTREAAPYIQSHLAVHAREPQTLAYALNDSPAGLAAWLWTRRRWWSDCGGDVLSAFDRDFLCATASLYWFTRTIGSSMRYYAEAGRMTPTPPEGRRIEVPTAFAVAPKELLMVPRRIAEEKVNLQRWSVLPRGGHFVFAEQPQLMVQELREFFRDYR